ncbi:hypothetical protein BZA05DRAFT_447372 [Tricharina praecox]|uniref:uncharacterized protein n=1 Tax=Tricharina praecox TaxID=43433 RepID=UPI00221E699C|nr:uncharacterized protein BZA05DRAFT_447372 [Tricharina praecox]KAI5846736.1 hypothetical protein BZA05DRAFT_447372 [Tricharina praecox]
MENITLLGCGTIGLSFAAVHLRSSSSSIVTILDPRPDLATILAPLLAVYGASRVLIAPTLSDACTSRTHLVQESGPESVSWKTSLWAEVEGLVSAQCQLWSSTSGIPASVQGARMQRPARLIVVHPFNPPAVMPLIEIVPGPGAEEVVVERAREYWERVGYRPVVIREERKGFVANRLAFVMLREAVGLVQQGVVGVREVDAIVENSVGLRWGVRGPFRSYHDGGGELENGGLRGFLEKVGGTVREVWAEGEGDLPAGWEETVIAQTEEAYGSVTQESLDERDRITRRVLQAIREEKEAIELEKVERGRAQNAVVE